MAKFSQMIHFMGIKLSIELLEINSGQTFRGCDATISLPKTLQIQSENSSINLTRRMFTRADLEIVGS